MTMEAFGEEEFGEERRWEKHRSDDPDGPPSATEPGWLSDEELAATRGRVPILYVEAVPVRVDHLGRVTQVGLLLRSSASTGRMTRSLVSGRVLHGEPIRDALLRHLEKDLGPVALPVLPTAVVPAAVTEYFPFPGVSYHDPRQHAVALAYLVPVAGECQPRQDALEITWLKPHEAISTGVADEMEGGRGSLLRHLLRQVGAVD